MMTRHCLKTKIKKNFQQHGTFKMMRFEWNEFFFCKKLVLKTVQTHKLLHLYLEKPKRFNTKKKKMFFSISWCVIIKLLQMVFLSLTSNEGGSNHSHLWKELLRQYCFFEEQKFNWRVFEEMSFYEAWPGQSVSVEGYLMKVLMALLSPRSKNVCDW